MDISAQLVAGGSIVKLPPAFSTNGESIFVARANTVYQYSTKTGQLVHQYDGWDKDLVGLVFTQIDNLECLVGCSKDGKIVAWKVTNKVPIVEALLPRRNITSFHVVSGSLTKGLRVLIAYATKKKRVVFGLVNTKSVDEMTVYLRIPKSDYALDVCPGRYCGVATANFVHFFKFTTTPKVSSYQMAKDNRQFTCLACHPCDELVLTGDDSGRVVLWSNIFGKKAQSVYHWHTLPVKTVAFSTLGSYFYSGAGECVLVKWQLNNSNDKQFLPRLPAGIVQLKVSDNNAFVAVATQDNAIRVVDSQLRQVNLIQHLVVGDQFTCGLTYDPITRSLVMNGNVGCVQFYSPSDQDLLYNVEIVGQNKVTEERECRLSNTVVSKIALSQSGAWLATVEERQEEDVCKELRLKFWFFSQEKRNYELNTSVEFPHESSVRNLLFQPGRVDDDLKCVTVSLDKTFKIWQVVHVSTVHRTGLIWRCTSRGTFRDLPCAGLSFTIDGSLFGVGFGKLLTIWATENCEPKASLIHANFKETAIEFVQFGQGNQCHLVAAASTTHLSVWNILSLTLSWVVRLPKVVLMVAEPQIPYIAVVCQTKKGTNKLYLFEPSSPALVFSKVLPVSKNGTVAAGVLVPNSSSSDTRLGWQDRTDFYFITSKNELYRLSNKSTERNIADTSQSEEMSVFKKLKPEIRTSQVKTQVEHHLFPKEMGYKSFKEYLDAPLETLSPVQFIAASLLQGMVLQRDPTDQTVG